MRDEMFTWPDEDHTNTSELKNRWSEKYKETEKYGPIKGTGSSTGYYHTVSMIETTIFIFHEHMIYRYSQPFLSEAVILFPTRSFCLAFESIATFIQRF